MYKRIISLILAISLIHTLVPIQGYAISESDFTDWFNEYSPSEAQIVANSLGVRSNVEGKYINKYFLNLGDKSKLVYGTPFDWKNGHGYRYLGYNQNGDPFTNQEYIPDSMSDNFDPKEKNWIEKPWKYPHSDLITAQGLPKPTNNYLSYTPEWLKDAYTTVVGYYELTDFGIPSDQLYLYASIIQEPQTYSEGAVILYHYAAGRYWYLTLTIPPKQIPRLQDPTIDIKVKSSTNSESNSITVEEGESYEVIDRCKSAYQDLGSQIIRYEVKKEKKEGNNWTTILSETLMHTGIEDDRSYFFKNYTDPPGQYRYTITEIEDLLGPISTNSKSAYVTVGEGGSEEPPEEPPEDINAVIDGPNEIEKGKTLTLDSSDSTSVYPIVKREWYRKASTGFYHYSKWDDKVEIEDSISKDTTKSYYDYKLVITDSKGNTDEAIHRVYLKDKVEPNVNAVLTYDAVFPEKIEITKDELYEDKEYEIKAWVSGKNSYANKGRIYNYWFWKDKTKDELPLDGEEDGYDFELKDKGEEDFDPTVLFIYKVRPSNPNIKASLRVRSTYNKYDTDTAYYTVPFIVNVAPPETQLNIPDPFYPKEVNVLENKTITWDYFSKDDIPYDYSKVSLYKVKDGNYEVVFEDKTFIERTLVVEGNAGDIYEIEVQVYDNLNNASKTVKKEFTITNAVPIIDLELDTSLDGILGIEVKNLTPTEVEELFPTSYTTWGIQDENGNVLIYGEGEAPKTVVLDDRFDSGKFKVTQNAINTIGATAQANKDFEIQSVLNFEIVPNVLFEGEYTEIVDKSRGITDKAWTIRGNDDIEFDKLEMENNKFTRDKGIYEVKLEGKGYTSGIGITDLFETEQVIFKDTKPVAAFNITGYKKMYKEIYLDGSVSTIATESTLQEKYPIQFDSLLTQFVIEPITEQNGAVDTSRNKYILGKGKEVINDRVVFRGKEYQSIRIDKGGWYRALYKVYNGKKESDWTSQEFYVSSELMPTVDINVKDNIVYRDPNNELKSKLTITVDYSSPDDEIDLDKSKLLIRYDYNNDGDYENDGVHSQQYITQNVNDVQSYISEIEKTYTDKKAIFNLYIDNTYKNHFGKFKFDFIAVEKPSIPNYNIENIEYAPIMQVNTLMCDDKKKIIFIDNKKPIVHLTTGTENSVKVWILEDSSTPFTNADIERLIQELSLERINVEIYIIDAQNDTVRKYTE